MPRNRPPSNWSVTSDPLNIPIEELERLGLRPTRPATAPSVLSPEHPANSRNHHSEAGGTYTFRQRNMQLDLTLGWEMEANHAPRIVPAGVENIGDGSVNGEGSEFVVMPAITKSPRYVLGLLKDLVHAPKLNTDESCGFHVHVSASNLASTARMRQWAIATEFLAMQIEPLAFQAVPESRAGNRYCRKIVPIANGTSFSSSKYNNSRRYHWLNIVEMFRPNGIRTIENRLLGHTHRWKYVLAWTLFTMELARRGWDLSNRPFDRAGHVDALSVMLKDIAKEIKPLSRRAEPIPQWVYNGLKQFGIEESAWARPLARLTEVESDLRGLIRPVYSDNQPEVPNVEEDEDSNVEYCACGCGEDVRCSDQVHNDGDCDSSECYSCHDEGNCAELPDCYFCRQRAHENNERCGSRSCSNSTCNPQPRRRPTVSRTMTDAVRPITATEGMPIHSGNGDPLNTGAYVIIPRLTFDMASMQSSSMWITGTPVEPTQETERRAYEMLDAHEVRLSEEREFFGQAVRDVLSTLPEELALPMSDAERLASDGRERTYTGPLSSRNVTIAEHGARSGRLGYCGPDCRLDHHGATCGVCGLAWEGSHRGHRCLGLGGRGMFLIGGR